MSIKVLGTDQGFSFFLWVMALLYIWLSVSLEPYDHRTADQTEKKNGSGVCMGLHHKLAKKTDKTDLKSVMMSREKSLHQADQQKFDQPLLSSAESAH